MGINFPSEPTTNGGIYTVDNSSWQWNIASQSWTSIFIPSYSIPGTNSNIIFDGNITTAKLQDGIVTNDKIQSVEISKINTTGATNGYYLVSQGGGAAPIWAAAGQAPYTLLTTLTPGAVTNVTYTLPAAYKKIAFTLSAIRHSNTTAAKALYVSISSTGGAPYTYGANIVCANVNFNVTKTYPFNEFNLTSAAGAAKFFYGYGNENFNDIETAQVGVTTSIRFIWDQAVATNFSGGTIKIYGSQIISV